MMLITVFILDNRIVHLKYLLEIAIHATVAGSRGICSEHKPGHAPPPPEMPRPKYETKYCLGTLSTDNTTHMLKRLANVCLNNSCFETGGNIREEHVTRKCLTLTIH